MEARGYEQNGLAEAMKVSDSTVSRWLDGAAPDPDQLARLATVLDVTTDELLRPATGAAVAERADAPYGARKKSEDELLLRKYEAVLRRFSSAASWERTSSRIFGASSINGRGKNDAPGCARRLDERTIEHSIERGQEFGEDGVPTCFVHCPRRTPGPADPTEGWKP